MVGEKISQRQAKETRNKKRRAFLTGNARTRRQLWDTIRLELGYACSPPTVKKMPRSMRCCKQIPLSLNTILFMTYCGK
jgi:hypothetical protein